MGGKTKTSGDGGAERPGGKEAERRARQAEALRDNLRRRKLQARERAETSGPAPDATGSGKSRDT